MATRGKGTPATGKVNGSAGTPRSLKIAEEGIRSSRDFRDLMSAIMSDVVAGRLTPNVTTAACNAGGKLLKMVELEHRYGGARKAPGLLAVAFDTTPALTA